jgi:hypothetical protein
LPAVWEFSSWAHSLHRSRAVMVTNQTQVQRGRVLGLGIAQTSHDVCDLSDALGQPGALILNQEMVERREWPTRGSRRSATVRKCVYGPDVTRKFLQPTRGTPSFLVRSWVRVSGAAEAVVLPPAQPALAGWFPRVISR